MTSTDAQIRPDPGLIRTVIISYGDGHHDAPRGDALRVDCRPLRNPPEDPAVRDRMLRRVDLHVLCGGGRHSPVGRTKES
ncbi:hypothetical protein ACEZDB_35665 [Streptacidiphilus sp. N1-3]|uniref:Uncharacterized protein n=1 Tax=Streptacidiphilus alkalitolerans TaxID=3342712 RepID=A0ABV6XCQ8_9ACTN